VSDEVIRRAFEVKLLGYRRAAAAARDRLPEDGAIVLLSGEAAVQVVPDYFAAGLVNAAVETLTRYLAVEYAPIRVSAVSPNVVDTSGMSREARETVAERVQVGRVGEPEDIADAVLFLLANPNATRETLRLNGGSGVS
jgi:NAD(P)-dependent dehydrogenase (short-subunit alcohol dehydrogenase family)